MDKKEANLVPYFCTSEDSSSSSSSDDSDDSEESKSFRSESSNKLETFFEKNFIRAKKFPKKLKKKQTKWATYWNRYKRFVHSPRVHFVYDAIFYVIFLMLFSYIILCEFNYSETIEEISQVEPRSFSNAPNSENFPSYHHNATFNYTHYETNISSSKLSNLVNSKQENKSSNSTIFINKRTVIKMPSNLEYLLIYWMFAFAMEEGRQYFFGDAETKIMKNKLLHYFENNWNYLDISGCLVFSIGMSLRFISLRSSETLFIAARIILCIDLVIWYVRLLHVSIIFKSLGPKLVMIQKMIRDLMFFISIIAIFVCAFGVTTQATLFPGNKLDFALVRSMLNKAYWPIYGEMKILDDLDVCHIDEKNVTVCPQTSGVAFSYIALMIYMVIANVLLINLLIAMFSSTFQDVQENTDKIWKFQRYRLVFEYYDSPILPPPLNFIAYVVALIKYFKTRNLEKLNQKNLTEDINESSAKDEVDLLLDRERKYAEEYLRMEKFRQKETTDSRLKWNVEKLETLEQKLNEVIETRYKETNQISDAINWIMTQMDQTKAKAPFIQNVKSGRKMK